MPPAEQLPIRVLIAEDHELMREGTRRILEQYEGIEIAGEAADGPSALDLALTLRPDVLLLDIRLPGLSGIDVTREIEARMPEINVLIISAYDDDDYVRALFEAGASGYMLKTIGADQLADAVRRVGAGETVIHPAIARKVARLIARPSSTGSRDAHLTNKELEVLSLVCQGLRNKEIARDLAISVRTVEGHLDSIFTRLGVRSRTEAAMYAASHHLFDEEDG